MTTSNECSGSGQQWSSGTGNPICPVCHRGWRGLGLLIRPKRNSSSTIPTHVRRTS